MGCKKCGSTEGIINLVPFAEGTPTVFFEPVPNFKFSQQILRSSITGVRYLVSSTTKFFEVDERDIPFVAGYAIRGRKFFQQVTDSERIEDFKQQLIDAEQAKTQNAQTSQADFTHYRQNVREVGRVAGYLMRYANEEVSFAEVNAQIKLDMDKAKVTRSEIEKEFVAAYQAKSLDFAQLLTQVDFQNAKLIATDDDLIEHLVILKNDGLSDSKLDAAIQDLLATTKITEERIQTFVQVAFDTKIIGKTLAAKYIELPEA